MKFLSQTCFWNFHSAKNVEISTFLQKQRLKCCHFLLDGNTDSPLAPMPTWPYAHHQQSSHPHVWDQDFTQGPICWIASGFSSPVDPPVKVKSRDGHNVIGKRGGFPFFHQQSSWNILLKTQGLTMCNHGSCILGASFSYGNTGLEGPTGS